MLWNKADFTAQFANSFLENTIDTPIQNLWDAYKAMCFDLFIPIKSVPTGECNQLAAWATPFIRRLSSKKQLALVQQG